mgnify:CR=1 FL=1
MKKSNLDKIKLAASRASDFPKAIIEYNFEEIPEDEGITKDNFYGVPAVFNKMCPQNSATVIYKY